MRILLLVFALLDKLMLVEFARLNAELISLLMQVEIVIVALLMKFPQMVFVFAKQAIQGLRVGSVPFLVLLAEFKLMVVVGHVLLALYTMLT